MEFRTDHRIPRHRPGAALLVAVAALVAVVAGACGSSTEARSAAPPTRPEFGPITAPPTTHPPIEQLKTKSQPYWVPVVDLNGTGTTTTAPFTIGDTALQWRATYHCEGTFKAVAVDAAGQPAKRPLADATSCGEENKGYGTGSGPFTLQVTATAPWDAKIEQQIDTPLVEPPVPDGATVVATANVYNVDRDGEGTATIYRLADGSQLVRLDNFYITLNSDLELRFSPLPEPKTTDEIAAAPFTSLGVLKATVGSMSYPVPPDVDLSGYNSIVFWCEITRNAYAAASLQRA